MEPFASAAAPEAEEAGFKEAEGGGRLQGGRSHRCCFVCGIPPADVPAAEAGESSSGKALELSGEGSRCFVVVSGRDSDPSSESFVLTTILSLVVSSVVPAGDVDVVSACRSGSETGDDIFGS